MSTSEPEKDGEMAGTKDINTETGADLEKAEGLNQTTPLSDALAQQLHFDDVKISFFALYRHATFFDLIIVAISTVCAVVAGAVVPIAPIVTAEIFLAFSQAEASGEDLGPFIDHYTLWYVYFTIITLVTWIVGTAGFVHTGAKITRKIKAAYFAAVLRQNMAVFDDKSTGDILAQLTSDTNIIQDALSLKLALTINAVGQLLATIIMCFSLDWLLTFETFWAMLLAFAIVYVGGVATVRYSGRSLDALSAGTGVVEEALGAIKSTTALGMQSYAHRMYMDHVEIAAKNSFVLKALNGAMVAIAVGASYINVALAFWQGSRQLTDGRASFIHVVAFTIIIKSSAFCVLGVGSNMEAFTVAVAAARRLFPMVYRISPIDSSATVGKVLSTVEGTIELRNVKHIYPTRPTITVLDDVSIRFSKGKTTAIVGSSGSAKSSIASLLLRFYDPLVGSITLDGTSLSAYQLPWLRQQVHVVTQEPFLFNKTVYENIEYGFTNPQWRGVSAEKQRMLIHEAARAAQAHDFITRLPQGYETLVGTRGSRLSGGQAQRIALARALVGEPRILILDESTSALDSETEAKVLAGMSTMLSSCTRIVIAHRLSTIRDADNIIVMKEGRVAETGTHAELTTKEATYYDLVRGQDLGSTESIAQEDSEIAAFKLETPSDTPQLASPNGKESVFLASAEVDAQAASYSLMSLLRFGLKLNGPERHWMLLALLCSVLAGGEEPGSAILFGKPIVAISQHLDDSQIVRSQTAFYSWMFFLLAMVVTVCFGAQGIALAYCSEKTTNRARSMAFAKMLSMAISFFDKKLNSAGALASFLSTSTRDLEGISGGAISIILICLSIAISGIIVSFAFGWKLTLVCLALFPLLIASGYFGVWLVGEFEKHTEVFSNEAAEFASETLSGIRTIVVLTREDTALETFRRILNSSTSKALKANLQTSVLYALSRAIYYACMALSFWYGSKLVLRHEYTLFAFITIQSSMLMSAYSAGLTSAIDPSSTSGEDFGTPEGQIEFKAVGYAYPSRPDHMALDNLSLTIPAGSNVAFVGPTGSGKSTVVSIIERFFDPNQGSIFLDTHPLPTLNVARYRRRIGLVNQEPTLFNGTIRQNLVAELGEDIATPSNADVEKACRQANIYNFIMDLPQGMDTVVSNRGNQLSVGQKQRIALARALLRQPAILLLDEATSSLDSQSEAMIKEALDEAKHGRTTITIAHRLSTIMKADRIFVLDGGRLVQSGTHAELMEKKGLYHRLFTTGMTGQLVA